jgi:predicted permease
MLNDLRYAIRMLLKNPGFTAVAVLTLALGIGANTAVFTMINAVLFKPMMARDPHQLVGVYQYEHTRGGDNFRHFSYSDFTDLRADKEVFADLAAVDTARLGWQEGDLTYMTPAYLVSANYFSVLGVPPALGRGFLPEEETSATSVAVLTHAFWQRLGGDPSIIGRTLKLTRGDVTVIGVMPQGFNGDKLLPPALFLPLGMEETLQSNSGQAGEHILNDREQRRFTLIGRLKPGLNLANVGGALSVLTGRFPLADPKETNPRTLLCTPPDRFDRHERPSDFGKTVVPVAALAQCLSILILFIACLNLANMMLARGAARKKEIAVRLAVGAGRRRILRQLLTEGLLLAFLGGAAGLLLSTWGTHLLATSLAGVMIQEFSGFNSIGDWRLLGALSAFSGLATLFFALGPALKLSRLDVSADLKRNEGEDTAGRRAGRLGVRNALAIGQMALSLTLLIAAALFTRSAINALNANPGFEFGSHFYMTLDDSLTGNTELQTRELVRAAIERLEAVPGVESVSHAMVIPFGPARMGRTVWPGAGTPSPEDKNLAATYNIVGVNYFRTLGIPLLRGREFERREVESTNAPPVVIISQKLADGFWPGQDPLGRSLQLSAGGPGGPFKRAEVVGVVPDIAWSIFDKERPAEYYEPLGQRFLNIWRLHVRVAPAADTGTVMAACLKELRQLDSRMPITDARTLTAMQRNSPLVVLARLGGMLFGAFGAVAMALSFLGVYGLKAYEVVRRTREIGIRMALGARSRDVLAMLLRESAWLAVWGLGLGLLLSLAMGRLASRFLYQVPAFDPLTFVGVPILLLTAVLIACSIPARRATKVDPMVALRHE